MNFENTSIDPIDRATESVPVKIHDMIIVSRVPKILQLIDFAKLLLRESLILELDGNNLSTNIF